MLKKIKFNGGFFTKLTELELFANEDRISLIFGKNGSGKSTISKAICKAKGDFVEDIGQAIILDHTDFAFSDMHRIHVFNEEYINSRVKLREDGLNTIVLLGELGDLEDKILDLKLRLEAETKRNGELKITSEEYKNRDNKKSPYYCRFQINLGLSGDANWAGREKIISAGKRNASVTDKVIDNIVALSPSEPLAVIKKRYEETLELLRQVRKNEATRLEKTTEIYVSYNEQDLVSLLAQKIESPVLTDREQYLIQLIDEGKLEQIGEMKSVFSKKKTTRCPFCLQSVTDQEKGNLIESIEKVLSKEIDIHEGKLKNCILQEINVDFSGMEVLNSDNLKKCKDCVESINKEIFRIREIILKKINHPYTPKQLNTFVLVWFCKKFYYCL